MLTELITCDTIGHKILGLEAELGIPAEPHKQTLDMLIEEARRAIQIKDAYTREDAVGILRAINSILQDNGFKHEGARIGEYLFYEGLRSKNIGSNNTSFIYLSIADALNLPLAAVSAPSHMFVRFSSDKGEINWDTTRAKEITDDSYAMWLNIPEESIHKGVYLRSLTPQETMGIAHNKLGVILEIRGELDKAMGYFNKAISLNPNYAAAYNNLGTAFFNQGCFDRAIDYFNEDTRVKPDYALACTNRGDAHLRISKPNNAKEDYTRAITINQDFTRAYYGMAAVNLRQLNIIGALFNLAKAIIPPLRYPIFH